MNSGRCVGSVRSAPSAPASVARLRSPLGAPAVSPRADRWRPRRVQKTIPCAPSVCAKPARRRRTWHCRRRTSPSAMLATKEGRNGDAQPKGPKKAQMSRHETRGGEKCGVLRAEAGVQSDISRGVRCGEAWHLESCPAVTCRTGGHTPPSLHPSPVTAALNAARMPPHMQLAMAPPLPAGFAPQAERGAASTTR